MIRRISTRVALLALLCGAPIARTQTVTFEMIPGVTSANDLTPDGRFVVGEIGASAYIYDTTSNTLTVLPGPGHSAAAVSDDGTVVLGDMPDPNGPPADVAGLWTAQTGWVSLGYLPNAGQCPSRSNGYELSADGSVAVGLSWEVCNGRGVVWTAQTGMLELEVLANGRNRASVVSGDGSLIGGFAQGTISRTPAYWDAATRQGELLDPNGDALGEIHGISDDGLIMLGNWLTEGMTNSHAVRWNAGPTGWTRQVLGEGSLNPGWGGIPMDIADSGLVVGFDLLTGARQAWILLPSATRMTDLATYIATHGGTPPGFTLEVCQAVSRNGRLICGHSYFNGAWLVRITPDTSPGDLNCDGAVNFDDINPFVLALSDPAGYAVAYPNCNIMNGDCNGDGVVNFDDINPFVALLTNP